MIYFLLQFFDKYYEINPNLEEIDIGVCNVTNEVLKFVGKFKKLTFLGLGKCEEITDDGMSFLSGLFCLKTVSLSLYGSTGVTKQSLKYLPKNVEIWS